MPSERGGRCCLVGLRAGEKRPGLDEGVLVAVFAAAVLERSIVEVVQRQCDQGHVWEIDLPGRMSA